MRLKTNVALSRLGYVCPAYSSIQMGHFAHHKSFGGAPIGEKYTTTPTQVKGANTYIIVGSLLPIWRTIPTEPLLQHLREPQLFKV